MRQYYVYIPSNHFRRLYVEVTNNLMRQVLEHKQKTIPGFTRRYRLTRLVYFESTSSVCSAIAREKRIKGWLPAKKVALIESVNPRWNDLSDD